MGEGYEGKVGEEKKSYAGNATDDTDMEGERPWSWMEEMAQDLRELGLKTRRYDVHTHPMQFLEFLGIFNATIFP